MEKLARYIIRASFSQEWMTYLRGESKVLRDVRDAVLDKTPEGRELINLYYEWSPVIAEAMEKDEVLKEQMKEVIDGVLELIREIE